jgi:nucleoside-diphosphate-sugar epimerase
MAMILLTGATGVTGSEIARQLITDVVKRAAGKDPTTFDQFLRDLASAFAPSSGGR